MKKRVIAMLLVSGMVIAMFAGCGKKETKNFSDDGKVINIYAWNEEFKGFFENYYAGKKEIHEGQGDYFDKAPGIPQGITVNWIINPSDGGVYQQKLDEALDNQSKASADNKAFVLAS